MNTMYDDFTVTLSSNVKEPTSNKPSLFETRLAAPIDLPGEWEVSLSTFKYPHNWLNIKDTYNYAITTIPADGETLTQFDPKEQVFKDINKHLEIATIGEPVETIPDDGETGADTATLPPAPTQPPPPAQTQPPPPAPTQPPPPPPTQPPPSAPTRPTPPPAVTPPSQAARLDNVDGDLPQDPAMDRIQIEQIRGTFDQLPANSNVEDVLDIFYLNVKEMVGSSRVSIKFNRHLGKVVVSTEKSFGIACPKSPSFLELLGFKADCREYNISDRDLSKGKYHLCHFEIGEKIASGPPLFPATLNHMFVYSDFVDISSIGDTRAPLLGHFPVDSLGSLGNYEPLHRRYVKVKPKVLSTITIKTCTSTGDLFPFSDATGLVICDLHFRRRNYFR